jgi:hypothetical protein
MKKSKQNCFKCGEPVKVDDQEIIHDALCFISHGGFGSNYDPMSHSRWLRIHLCDPCVEQGARIGLVLEATSVRREPDITYRRYDPDGGDAS